MTGMLTRCVMTALAAMCCAWLGTAEAHEAVTYLLPASPNQPAFAPWLLAQQLGYYADAGYQVRFVAAQGGMDVARQLAAGRAPVGGAIGDTPILARAEGLHVKAIAVLGGGSLTVIVAGQGSGARAIADLRGKRILVLSRSDSTYYVLRGALASSGIRETEVTIETAGPRDIIGRVIAGTADACACVPDWQVQIVRAQPTASVIPTDRIFPSMAQAIVTSDATIAAKPDMLRGIVSATLRGMRFVMDHPRGAANAFAHIVPRYHGQEALLAQMFQAYAQETYAGQKVLGEIDAGRLEAVQRFYREQGFVANNVPVGELYSSEFLR